MPTSSLNAIKTFRERKRPPWSQADLARRIGSTQWNVSAYELGTTVPSLQMACQIGNALGTSLEKLFFGLYGDAAHRVGGRLQGARKPSKPS